MVRDCVMCGRPFQARRSTARYCSSTCRARRAQGRSPRPVDTPAPTAGAPLVVQVRRALEAAGRLDTYLGQQALTLAERLAGQNGDSGAAVAALSRELRSVMREVLEGTAQATDLVDELEERRRRKTANA